MFTGIIETLGSIREIKTKDTNKTYWIESSLGPELKVDQSLSHDGVCLTVEEIKNNLHRVTAIAETLHKTNLGTWKTGDVVNLERCLKPGDRLDGHFVQGHVDTTGTCTGTSNMNGSWKYTIQFPEKFAGLLIEKGSISLNGISLTIFDLTQKEFSVAIIPYTYEHTNLKKLAKGDRVNLEFDMIGKYVNRITLIQNKTEPVENSRNTY
ncbi:MAG: riboflavin synthase [Bacteroidetes bacterium]|nr:MAG: riboflavin synthase [Bacteroidota bacterium]